MRGGRLDRMVTIQSGTQTQLPSGEPILTWTNLDLRRPASMAPVRGEERFTEPEKVAYDQVSFRIRYSLDVAGLSPLGRIIHPALTEAEAADSGHEIPHRNIYDILTVNEIGRREGLEIITQRRSDVLT